MIESKPTNIRVLFVGQNWHGSNATSCKRALRMLGCDVFDLDDYHYFPQWRLRHLKIIRRILYPIIIADFNSQLELQVQRFQPDLVFVFKGTMVRPQTINRIRLQGHIVINFYPDADLLNNPQHRNFLQSVTSYDCVFTPKSFHIHDLREVGAKRVEFLPYAFDPWCHFPVEIKDSERRLFNSDLVFIGSWGKERAEFLESLVSMSFPYQLAVWGNHWDALSMKSPLRPFVKFKPANGMTQAKVFGASKIALAFLKPPDIHTARTFEIPAFGVFMLAERSAEHISFFEENREIACFDDVIELRDKIDFYLSHESKRQAIALAGYEKVTKKGHSYIDRMRRVLDVYNEIKNG